MNLLKIFFISISILVANEKIGRLPWKSLEILNAKSTTGSIYPIKLDKQRQGFIVIFPKQSKLSIFEYKKLNGKIEREDLTLKSLTIDFLSADIDDDGKDEIIYISHYPHEVTILKKYNSSWIEDKLFKIDGKLAKAVKSIAFNKKQKEIILTLTNKLAIISLPKNKVSYTQDVSPLKIVDSWIYDLNSDGEKDIISLLSTTSKNKKKLLTYQIFNNNTYLSEKILLQEENSTTIKPAYNNNQLEFFSLNDNKSRGKEASIQRYRLENTGEAKAFGYKNILPFKNTKKESWTSTKVEGEIAIASINDKLPILNYYQKKHKFWKKVSSSPIMDGTLKVVVHPYNPKQLLFLVKDLPFIYTSFLKGKTFSFPKVFASDFSSPDKAILDLYSDKYHTFWTSSDKKKMFSIQEITEDNNDGNSPIKVSTLNLPKVKRRTILQARAINNNQVIFTTKESPFITVATNSNNKTTVKKSFISKKLFPLIKLTPVDEKNKILSFQQNGTVNILNNQLEIENKVALFNGRKIVDYLFLENDSVLVITDKLALLKLKKGEDNIFFIEKTLKDKIDANKIAYDSNLQHIFINKKQASTLDFGQDISLKKVEVIAQEVNAYSKNINWLHHFHTLDIDGDKEDELFLFDFTNRIITALDIKNKAKKLFSWKVFDSPYRIKNSLQYYLTLDFNGDEKLDLILKVNNKILCYLSKNEQNN